jgi:hypothetical protein
MNKKHALAGQAPTDQGTQEREPVAPLLFLPFAAALIMVLAINLLWFSSSSPLAETEMPFRIVLGSLVIFLIPGLIWGEVLGFRATHILEMLALSFIITFSLEVILLPIPFLFKTTISAWILLLLVLSIMGTAILIGRFRKARKLDFLGPLFSLFHRPDNSVVSSGIFLLIILFISRGAYRWGEELTAIDGEKLLHLLYIRQYFCLPLNIGDLGPLKGMPPANMINLWEFLVAAWARLIHSDPLPLYFRARMVIPLLGLPGIFLLILSLFPERKKAEALFSGIVIMAMGWFMLLSPSCFDYIKSEKFRGLMAFMGSAHHSDSAMDILIAPGAALIFLWLRKAGWRFALLIAAFLAGSFLWHPREFFQEVLYGGIAGLALLLSRRETWKAGMKRFGLLVAIIACIGFILLLCMHFVVPSQAHGYDEGAIKMTALRYAFLPENVGGVRNLFLLPPRLELSSMKDPDLIKSSNDIRQQCTAWQFVPWLILSAFFLPLLSFFGDREDRDIALFYLLLWFLALAWNFSMLLILALTYSEFYMGALRIIYIFAYIIIADGFFLLSPVFSGGTQKGARLLIMPSVLFLSGCLTHLVWSLYPVNLFRSLSVLLCIAAIGSFMVLLVPTLAAKKAYGAPHISSAIIGMILFFLPIMADDYALTVPNLLSARREQVNWFVKGNPLGFSPRLIRYLRGLPPKNTILVDPLGKSCIFIYSPQYSVVIPAIITTIIKDREVYREVAEGRHPLFIPLQPVPEHTEVLIDHAKARKWLDRYKVNYVLAEGRYYDVLHSYAVGHPESFSVAFDAPRSREALFLYINDRQGK